MCVFEVVFPVFKTAGCAAFNGGQPFFYTFTALLLSTIFAAVAVMFL